MQQFLGVEVSELDGEEVADESASRMRVAMEITNVSALLHVQKMLSFLDSGLIGGSASLSSYLASLHLGFGFQLTKMTTIFSIRSGRP